MSKQYLILDYCLILQNQNSLYCLRIIKNRGT